MALSKDKILRHAGVFKTREVHIPAWADEAGDDTVLVRGMTVREFEINQARADDGKATASVMARCVLDPSGLRVFDDADVSMIAELPVAQVQVISKAILEESGVLEADSGADVVTKAVSDAEGNSEATPSDSSPSD